MLIPSQCLRLPHHIKLKDERYIKSVCSSSIFSLGVMVCTTETLTIMVFILNKTTLTRLRPPFSPPPVHPLHLSLDKTRSRVPKKHCINIPCRHPFRDGLCDAGILLERNVFVSTSPLKPGMCGKLSRREPCRGGWSGCIDVVGRTVKTFG